MTDRKTEEGSSFMWDHYKAAHSHTPIDIHNDYHFRIIQKQTDCMTRQINEAVRIDEAINNGIHVDTRGNHRLVKCINRKEETFKAKQRNLDMD